MDVLGKAHEVAVVLGHVTTYDVDGRFFATKEVGGYVGLYGGERECSELSLDRREKRWRVDNVHPRTRQPQRIYGQIVFISKAGLALLIPW